jgi:hypothetical protein
MSHNSIGFYGLLHCCIVVLFTVCCLIVSGCWCCSSISRSILWTNVQNLQLLLSYRPKIWIIMAFMYTTMNPILSVKFWEFISVIDRLSASPRMSAACGLQLISSHSLLFCLGGGGETMKESSVPWDIAPCSQLETNRLFWRTRLLCLETRRLSHARNQHEASSKQSQATCSSETSVDFLSTTLFNIAEGTTLRNHRCEALKSCKTKNL